MNTLTAACRWTKIVLYILLLIFCVYFVLPFLGRDGRGRAVKRLAGMLPGMLGLEVVVRGELPDDPMLECGRVSSGVGYMVCANHVSFIDIFAIDSVLPVKFVAKKEIASWPIFGTIAKAAGTIFIDRSRKRAVLEVSEQMSRNLEAGGNVVFFPEGTTGTGEGLLPFHANLFSAAASSQAGIIPVALRYLQNGCVTTKPSYADVSLLDVLKTLVREKGIVVEVNVLPVIDPAGMDRKTLALEASRVMSAALGVPDATLEKDRTLGMKRAAVDSSKEG